MSEEKPLEAKIIRVTLYVKHPETAQSPTQANQWIEERRARLGEPAYQVIQSIQECELKSLEAGAGLEVGASFAGRLFGPEAEIRWVQDGTARYLLWCLSEKPLEEAAALPCRVEAQITTHQPGDEKWVEKPVRHYLLGVYEEKSNEFRERNLSPRRDYSFVKNAKDRDRVYLEVIEYLAGEPDCQAKREEFLERLNQPRVIAHRLTGVSWGQEPLPREEE